MKLNRLIIGLISIQVLFLSCAQNDIIPVVPDYKYDSGTISNLNEFVECVHFIDENTGFASAAGKICKTTDAGKSWRVDSITDLTIHSIYFLNKSIGFAVGGKLDDKTSDNIVPGSIILKTTDGGNSWVKQKTPNKDSELNSVFFINENVGFAVGLGLHVKTIDGGKTWNEFEFDYIGLMRKVSFIDSQTGFAVGTQGYIFKTIDQGKNWTKSTLDSKQHIYDFQFVNSSVGYASGQLGIAKTTDGGETWTTLAGSPSEMSFIHFVDENKGIAIGKGHYNSGSWTTEICCTTDGGLTWKIEDDVNFVSIASFPTKNIGFSVMTKSTVKIEIL